LQRIRKHYTCNTITFGENQLPETVPERVDTGQLWALGPHRLLCGDAGLKDNVTRVMDGNSPILMITDPSYGVDVDADVDWSGVFRLFLGNVVYIWHAAQYTARVYQSIKDIGFDVRAQIIWLKGNAAESLGDYHWQHEPCWYAVRDGKDSNWQDVISTTVWTVSYDGAAIEHAQQKPVKLMCGSIVNHTKVGDTVYDPFVGTGTTLIAAHGIARVCYAMDISPRCCDMVLARWEEFSGEKAVRMK